MVASGGTGQMLSLPMNEAIQEMFKEIYIDLEFKVVELEALYMAWRAGAKADMNKDMTRQQHRLRDVRPGLRHHALLRLEPGRAGRRELELLYQCRGRQAGQRGLNTFDAAKQDALMARVHEKVVDDAVLIWVVHDTNPHALSPKIKSYVQAQHWFQDLTTIGV